MNVREEEFFSHPPLFIVFLSLSPPTHTTTFSLRLEKLHTLIKGERILTQRQVLHEAVGQATCDEHLGFVPRRRPLDRLERRDPIAGQRVDMVHASVNGRVIADGQLHAVQLASLPFNHDGALDKGTLRAFRRRATIVRDRVHALKLELDHDQAMRVVISVGPMVLRSKGG